MAPPAAAMGLSDALWRTLRLCDYSVRGALVEQVVLVGGGSMLRGVAERLVNELRRPLEGTSWAPKVVARADRRYAAWQGGAVLGAMSTAIESFVWKHEHNEGGGAAAWAARAPPLAACTPAEQEATAAAAAAAEAAAHAADAAVVRARALAMSEEGRRQWREAAPPHSAEELRRQRIVQQGLLLAWYDDSMRSHLAGADNAPAPRSAAAAAAAAATSAPPPSSPPSAAVAEALAVCPPAAARTAAVRAAALALLALGDGQWGDWLVACRVRQRLQARWASAVHPAATSSTLAPTPLAPPPATAWLHAAIGRRRLRASCTAWACRAQQWHAAAGRHEAAARCCTARRLRSSTRRWVAAWTGAVLRVHEARHRGEAAVWRRGMTGWRAWRDERAASAHRVVVATRRLRCWRAWYAWRSWRVHYGAAAALLRRSAFFFAAWRLLGALESCRRRRGRARLLDGIADAIGALRRLEALARGWRGWRALDMAAEDRFASRARRRLRASLRCGWRLWCRDRLANASAGGARWRSALLREQWQGWRLRRAMATLRVRLGGCVHGVRLLAVAQPAGDAIRRARALARWARQCVQREVKHARLEQAARRFERCRERLQMATALGTLHTAQATVEAELIYLSTKADAVVHMARLSDGWKAWRQLVRASHLRRLQACAETAAALAADARAPGVLHGRAGPPSSAHEGVREAARGERTASAGGWAAYAPPRHPLTRAPLVDEHRKWRHQERVLRRLSRMLDGQQHALRQVHDTLADSQDGTPAGTGPGTGAAVAGGTTVGTAALLERIQSVFDACVAAEAAQDSTRAVARGAARGAAREVVATAQAAAAAASGLPALVSRAGEHVTRSDPRRPAWLPPSSGGLNTPRTAPRAVAAGVPPSAALSRWDEPENVHDESLDPQQTPVQELWNVYRRKVAQYERGAAG